MLLPPTATVESPMRGDAHGEFGERPEETGQEQSWHRTSGRLHAQVSPGRPAVLRSMHTPTDPWFATASQRRRLNRVAPGSASAFRSVSGYGFRVDHTWQNPNRVPAAQGRVVTVPAVRNTAMTR
jgi:hypothetical protein